MSREAHVRFWERVGVRVPRATRLPVSYRSCCWFRIREIHMMEEPAGSATARHLPPRRIRPAAIWEHL